MPRLLFIVNVDWFFVSHRLPIAIDAVQQGYDVHVATTVTDKLSLLEGYNIKVHQLDLHRSSGGGTLIVEFIEILSLLRKISPDIVHLVTIKPVLLGGIAARIARVPAVVSAISGLGHVFTKRGFLAWGRRKMISILYGIALGHNNQRAIFQNSDDLSIISTLAVLPTERTVLIRGSGVDLNMYNITPLPKGIPIILFAARLLVDKGVREFVNTAKTINNLKLSVRFVLVGDLDPDNPASIQKCEIDGWEKSGEVEVWGYQDEMHSVLSSATVVVLPSYREGFPKVLIEAAASGRAVVTTDVPGCRDAIEDGVTGLLVPARSVDGIINAVLTLLEDPQRCMQMGKAGRVRAEQMYNVRHVVAKHLEIYKELICQGRS